MPNLTKNTCGKPSLTISIAMFMSFGITAQTTYAGEKPSPLAIKDTSKIAENKTGFKAGSFILAPIPIRSPSIGTGLALASAYLFQTDKKSDQSFIGVTAFRTDNGSKGYGLGGALSWGENKWTISVLAGEVDVVYDFYVPNTGGRTVSLNQDGRLLNLEGSYGLTDHFFLGLDLRYLKTSIQFSSPILTPANDRDLEIFSFGPTIEWDHRDDTIYPTSGFHVAIDSLHSIVLNGSDREYHKSVIKYDNYFSLFKKSVIATRLTACEASDQTPFFELCSVGGTDNFRGFPFGELLDQNLISGQIEFRSRIGKRFGYTVFAGVGGVANGFGGFNSDATVSAGGVGLRYRLSKGVPLDFAFDVAFNSNGETTSYITIGQRF
jgi:hypothetical protein